MALERKKQLYVRLSERIHDMLEKIAEAEGRTKQELAREAIAAYIKRWQRREKKRTLSSQDY